MTDHRSPVYGYGTSRDGGGGGSEGSPRKAATGSAAYAETQPRKIAAGGAVYAEANKPSRNLHNRHSIHFDTLDHALTVTGIGECPVYSLCFQMSIPLSELMVTNSLQGLLESPLDANIYTEALLIFWCVITNCCNLVYALFSPVLPRKRLGAMTE